MISETDNLFSALTDQIKSREAERNVIHRYELVLADVIQGLTRLKNLVKEEGFADEQEEIQFYKLVNPQFHSLYIYYATLFSVESDKPVGSKKTIRRYFRNELRRIDNFFYHNAEFYKYYHSGKTHLDKEYFIRGRAFNGITIDIIMPIIDPEFCTLHSIKVAFFVAYQQLRQYLQDAMLEIENPVKSPVSPSQQTVMKWTDSKTGLIELSYALHASGSFNNGKADLKQITDYLQSAFHVDLGNTSRTFQEILARKRGQTAYLDRLRQRLLQRIESDD